MNLLTNQRTADVISGLYQDLEEQLMQNIVQHIKTYNQPIDSDDWLLQRLAEIGKLNQENIKIIAQQAGISQTAVERMLIDASQEAVKQLDIPLKNLAKQSIVKPAVSVSKSENVKNTVDKLCSQAKDTLNLCNTTMLYKAKDAYQTLVYNICNTAKEIEKKQSFIDVLNRNAGNVVTGAESRAQAVKHCIEQFNNRGIPAFVDKVGREWTPEAYVNMAIRNTIKNVADEAQSARCKDYGINLIEIDSHSGARPKCAKDQGKIYDLDNQSGETEDGSGRKIRYYPWSSSSYGEPDGILGINCRHHKYPFVPKVHIRRYFPTEDIDANDKLYKETQIQRALERDVRKQKRECMLFDELGDTDSFEKSAVKLKAKEARLKQYVDGNDNLHRRKDREQVVGFDKSVSSKASAKAQLHYKKWAKSVGAERGPKTLAGYYDLKYNDNKESRLYKGYISAVNKGRISPLVGYDKFKEIDGEISKSLDGLKTSDGQVIKGHTAHFVDRIIGTHESMNVPATKELKKRLNHASVTVQEAQDTISNGKAEPVVIDKKGRKSQRFIGENCIVTFNPTSGELIQTNRKR